MKDLLSLGLLLGVFTQALKILKSLCKAKQHLNIFCKYQQADYEKKLKLIASTILLWGTQIIFCNLLLVVRGAYHNIYFMNELFLSQQMSKHQIQLKLGLLILIFGRS